MAGILAMLVAGCAKPPVEEQKAAKAAKEAASLAQAEVYAVASMNEAVKKWEDAEAKLQQQSYTAAKEAYGAATIAFQKAIDEVEVGKQAVKTENATAVATLEKGWAGLDKTIQKRLKKLRGIARTTWETDSKLIVETLGKAKDAATDPAELKKSLEEANKLVEKWLSSVK
jgi:hypothetical protein